MDSEMASRDVPTVSPDSFAVLQLPYRQAAGVGGDLHGAGGRRPPAAPSHSQLPACVSRHDAAGFRQASNRLLVSEQESKVPETEFVAPSRGSRKEIGAPESGSLILAESKGAPGACSWVYFQRLLYTKMIKSKTNER